MKRLSSTMLCVTALAALVSVFAMGAAAQQALEIQGRIVRTAPDQFIVETRDNKQVTLYTNPQTRYQMNNKAVTYSDLRAGANITARYVTEGDRHIVNAVTVAPVQATTPPRTDVAPATGGAQTAKGTVVEGEVVRVVGKDLVVIRTADGKEVMVYVSPETKYQLGAKSGQFSDLKPGASVGVDYDVRDTRNTARQVVGVNRVEGQVVRVVGQDQVIVRTPDGKEVTVYLSPETRYQLTPQGGGTYTDLRPGTDIGVYYDVRDQRPMARRIFPRRNR